MTEIIKKAQYEQTYNIAVEGLDNFEYIGKQTFTVPSGESYNVPLSLVVDPYDLKKPMTKFEFVLSVDSEPDVQISQPSNFFKGQ